MSRKNLAILALSGAILTSCASATCDRVEIEPLFAVNYKKITTTEFQCLSDKSYEKFRYNDIACKARIKTLNGRIDKLNTTK